MVNMWMARGAIGHIVLTCCFLSILAFDPGFDPDVGKVDLMHMEGCEHITADGEKQEFEWQNQEEVHDYDTLYALEFYQGVYMIERGESNATQKQPSSKRESVDATPRAMSKTLYKDVYTVSMLLYFESELVQYDVSIFPTSYLRMSFEVRGIYSKKTGLFCATFCVGSCGRNITDYHRGSYHMSYDPVYDSAMTPSEFVYKSTHSNQTLDSLPDSEPASSDHRVHLELTFPQPKTVASPFIHGVMTSLRPEDDALYFRPINISAVSHMKYEFSNTSVQVEAKNIGNTSKPDISPKKDLQVWSRRPLICPSRDDERTFGHFDGNIWYVFWNSSCGSSSSNRCSPFSGVKALYNSSLQTHVWAHMYMQNIVCSSSEWMIRAEFIFEKNYFSMADGVFDSQASNPLTNFLLVGEGYWDFTKPGQLVMLAHYFGSDITTPVDTRILITLQMPVVRTIHHRFTLVGHVRSLREASDPLYFSTFSFASENADAGSYSMSLDAVDYPVEYEVQEDDSKDTSLAFKAVYRYNESIKSKLEHACFAANSNTSKKHPKHSKFPLPDAAGTSKWTDFSISIGTKGSNASIRLSPFAIEDEVFEFTYNYYAPKRKRTGESQSYSSRTVIPISFQGRIKSGTAWDSKPSSNQFWNTDGLWATRIATEGWYNGDTGQLCMLGCQTRADLLAERLASAYENDDEGDSAGLESERCDLVFSIQYPPTNPKLWAKRPGFTGSITSLLNSSDPLYFKPLIMTSTEPKIYHNQVRPSVLRRHFETIISLVSSSLAVYFVAIQVGYSTRQSNSKNLRYVSTLMLLVLASGHFFPVMFNSTSIWSKRISVERQLNWFSEISWWQASQVIVRGTGLAALLLECRLLQVVWRCKAKANARDGSSKVKDISVFCTCLPIYTVVIAVVAFVHWRQPRQPHETDWEWNPSGRQDSTQISMIMADVEAFSGVILDLFLLPQVIANVLWNTDPRVAPLYPLFYFGMTALSSATHLFDAWRTKTYIPELESSMYYYANPNWDLYSNTWDILIPFGSVALAVVLFLQQRFGGRCIVPKLRKWKKFDRIPSHDSGLDL